MTPSYCWRDCHSHHFLTNSTRCKQSTVRCEIGKRDRLQTPVIHRRRRENQPTPLHTNIQHSQYTEFQIYRQKEGGGHADKNNRSGSGLRTQNRIWPPTTSEDYDSQPAGQPAPKQPPLNQPCRPALQRPAARAVISGDRHISGGGHYSACQYC